MTSPYSAQSAWGPGRNFTVSATGTPSGWGRGPTPRSILNPWGNNVPKSTPGNLQKFGASRRATPIPDASLFKIDYPANDPLAWPIAGGKRGPISGMTQAKADWNNSVVNAAYTRLYAGLP